MSSDGEDTCPGTNVDGTDCSNPPGFGSDDPEYCYHHVDQRDEDGDEGGQVYSTDFSEYVENSEEGVDS